MTASQEVALDAGKVNLTGRKALESSVTGSVLWSFLKDLTPATLALYTDRMTHSSSQGRYWFAGGAHNYCKCSNYNNSLRVITLFAPF